MIDANEFFRNSDLLDRLSLRQLSHIKGNWELTWDDINGEYMPEDNSYAAQVNQLLWQLSSVHPPNKYHDNEDRLGDYVQEHLKWKIEKIGNRWVGEDYAAILEQGGFKDVDQDNLLLAAAGRIKAARDRKQLHFDEMEQSHQKMLADVLAIILYLRIDA
jgi:hypothetical protein